LQMRQVMAEHVCQWIIGSPESIRPFSLTFGKCRLDKPMGPLDTVH
jgi:hypothetical protein